MSTFTCPLVRVGPVEKHANADSLGITMVGEYPVIVRLDGLREGDLAVYVPVDALCPPTGATAFLADEDRPNKSIRVKAKRLRGVFSMGLLLPAPADLSPLAEIGSDFAASFGITKWEEPEPTVLGGEDEKAPVFAPCFDVENWRQFSRMFADGEEVVVTEKIHGCNARFMVKDGALHVGSRTRWKKPDGLSVWARVAERIGLREKLADAEGFCVYGEVYGQVQDLKYGLTGADFAAFDVLDWRTQRYMDAPDAKAWCEARGIVFVPVIYAGPYSREAVVGLERGKTVIGNGAHIREGVVIRAAKERDFAPRACLKLVSEDYLLRKGGTEFH